MQYSPPPVSEYCTGNGFTVTATDEVAVLYPSLTTTVYTVLTVGATTAVADVEENPAGDEDQL